MRNVIIKKNDDHEIVKQYWKFVDKPEWLAVQYEYIRRNKNQASNINNSPKNKMGNQDIIENQEIIKVVTAIFQGADGRNWQKVEKSFADKVLLDYTTLSGGEPATLAPQEITAAWKTLLPGFDSTEHNISDFKVEHNGSDASLTNAVHALHYMQVDGKTESWIVDGYYSFQLKKTNGEWQVTAMKFIKENISGNLSLPEMASARVRKGR
jgi:hypothetical protein